MKANFKTMQYIQSEVSLKKLSLEFGGIGGNFLRLQEAYVNSPGLPTKKAKWFPIEKETEMDITSMGQKTRKRGYLQKRGESPKSKGMTDTDSFWL